MCRSFTGRPVPGDVLERALGAATRAPSAGNSQGWAFVVLQGEETSLFWAHQTDPSWRAHPSHPGLLQAPVLVLPLGNRSHYVSRYAEADKAAGLEAAAQKVDGWQVPYWLVDTAFATMVLLLASADEGLGALFFALRHPSRPLLDDLGVPEGWDPIGAVALGWPAADDVPATSAGRGRRPLWQVVHMGGWSRTHNW